MIWRHRRGTNAGSPPLDDFSATMLPHLDAAYTLARYLARDAGIADDIVQESFLRAKRNFAAYRGGADKAWLMAIVRNCFFDWARARQRAGHDETDPSDTVAIDDPEAIMARNGTIATVQAAIEALPPLFREAIILREIEGMSYQEIAQATDTPIGTVMSRLSRARLALAVILKATPQAADMVTQ
ncbi:sigma-70 family RNA polymerase sigma factor [Sphingomonas sp. 28-63-12]|uniref:sigma-70 family RNA polymerase sigma factor n=1 Tax=Sphingomonas sp. 28-63-12 TaxID=1970434 RepID=UPI0035A8B537